MPANGGSSERRIWPGANAKVLWTQVPFDRKSQKYGSQDKMGEGFPLVSSLCKRWGDYTLC